MNIPIRILMSKLSRLWREIDEPLGSLEPAKPHHRNPLREEGYDFDPLDFDTKADMGPNIQARPFVPLSALFPVPEEGEKARLFSLPRTAAAYLDDLPEEPEGTPLERSLSWEDQRIEALEKMLVDKAGICPKCGEEFSHCFDEPFADCRCGTCEWVGDGKGGGLPVIAVLRRR